MAPITDHLSFSQEGVESLGYHVLEIGVSVHTVVCFACRTTAETWLRRVAWSAVLCRILHSGVLQKCAIIRDVAYESLTLHHKSCLKCYLAL